MSQGDIAALSRLLSISTALQDIEESLAKLARLNFDAGLELGVELELFYPLKNIKQIRQSVKQEINTLKNQV